MTEGIHDAMYMIQDGNVTFPLATSSLKAYDTDNNFRNIRSHCMTFYIRSQPNYQSAPTSSDFSRSCNVH